MFDELTGDYIALPLKGELVLCDTGLSWCSRPFKKKEGVV